MGLHKPSTIRHEVSAAHVLRDALVDLEETAHDIRTALAADASATNEATRKRLICAVSALRSAADVVEQGCDFSQRVTLGATTTRAQG